MRNRSNGIARSSSTSRNRSATAIGGAAASPSRGQDSSAWSRSALEPNSIRVAAA